MRKAKKFLKIIYIQLILFAILINLCGCSNTNENEYNSSKMKSELSYLDSRFTTMINMMDNINLKNYEVSEEPNTQEGNNNEKSSSTQDSDSVSSTKETENSNSSNEGTAENNPKKYKLVSTNILTQEHKTDWSNLKNNLETLENVWPTIVLDLYEFGVNGQDILSVSNSLNSLVKYAKDEKKEETMKELANAYQYIPRFMENNSSDEILKNIYYTKSNVFMAYSFLDSQQWDEISKHLVEAQKNLENVLNKVLEGEKKEKEYNINKVYIELKELQNAVGAKDKELFLIKYKNLLEELDTI